MPVDKKPAKKKPNAWIQEVQAMYAKGGMTYKEALEKASAARKNPGGAAKKRKAKEPEEKPAKVDKKKSIEKSIGEKKIVLKNISQPTKLKKKALKKSITVAEAEERGPRKVRGRRTIAP